ncbi:hypothetical protein SUGI_1033020, partial [Cryptomeria japonica]
MLPSHISELSELRVLNLAYNAFSGPIPLALEMITKLKVLFINLNPNFVGNLVSLKNFRIGGNRLCPGVVPTEL